MKRFELKFLDGPGAGKSVWANEPHKRAWLCEEAGTKWWTFTEPMRPWIVVAEYKIVGSAHRREGTYLVCYGVVE